MHVELKARTRFEKGGRYYETWTARDLFGDLCVVRVWGGINTPRAQMRFQRVESEADAERALQEIAKRREAHGYFGIANSTTPTPSSMPNKSKAAVPKTIAPTLI
jgi:predicted DNA-binding WGR domain protein